MMFIKKISGFYKKEITLVDKIMSHFLGTLTPQEKLELIDIKSVLLFLQTQVKKTKIAQKINELSEKLNHTSHHVDLENLMKALNSFCPRKK